eukprot:g3567.t1
MEGAKVMLTVHVLLIAEFSFLLLFASASQPRLLCRGNELSLEDIPNIDTYNVIFQNSSLRDDAINTSSYSNNTDKNLLVYRLLPGFRVDLTKEELLEFMNSEELTNGVNYVECDKLHQYIDDNSCQLVNPYKLLILPLLILFYQCT